MSGRQDVSAPVKAAPEGRFVYDAIHNIIIIIHIRLRTVLYSSATAARRFQIIIILYSHKHLLPRVSSGSSSSSFRFPIMRAVTRTNERYNIRYQLIRHEIYNILILYYIINYY